MSKPKLAAVSNSGNLRRAGRAVECTSLENWQGFAPFVSSNLTPSANSTYNSLYLFNITTKHKFRYTNKATKIKHLKEKPAVELAGFFVSGGGLKPARRLWLPVPPA